MNHLDGCVFQTSDACRYFPKKLQSKAVVIFNSIKDDFLWLLEALLEIEF